MKTYDAKIICRTCGEALGELRGVPEDDFDAALDRAMRGAVCSKRGHTINTNIRAIWTETGNAPDEPSPSSEPIRDEAANGADPADPNNPNAEAGHA